MSLSRRAFVQAGALSLAAPAFFHRSAAAADAIRVGVLFSQAGGLSIIEKSLSDATLMAISEINAAGGVLGRQVQPNLPGILLHGVDGHLRAGGDALAADPKVLLVEQNVAFVRRARPSVRDDGEGPGGGGRRNQRAYQRPRASAHGRVSRNGVPVTGATRRAGSCCTVTFQAARTRSASPS